MHSSRDHISLKNLRQNNLKGIDAHIPLRKLTVVTGPSGAGKSSLAFQSLHAEGQRRYVETFSPYTRQFMELLDRPQVDQVENIRPSIAVQQANSVKTSRSTVGTLTELCDYFKIWFHHAAQLIDPESGEVIRNMHPQAVWSLLSEHYANTRCLIAFPLKKPGNMEWRELLSALQQQAYSRAIIAATETTASIQRIADLAADRLHPEAELWVIQDRVTIANAQQARGIEACTQAFKLGQGCLLLLDEKAQLLERVHEGLCSLRNGKRYPAASPALFSFNSPVGACPRCRGFGRIIEIDPQRVIPNPQKSIDEGAIRAFQGENYSEHLFELQAAAQQKGIRTDRPWQAMTAEEQRYVFQGDADYPSDPGLWYGIDRFFQYLEKKVYKMHIRVFLSKFRSYRTCPDCQGTRLKAEALHWKWDGYTLPELYQMQVAELLQRLPATRSTQPLGASARALENIQTRLQFLQQVGLGYLTLDRSSRTLSGGETMRVNLTSCLGSALTDGLFVLDEPTVGLHARDIDQLVAILQKLCHSGNTVVVVEHEEVVMRAADHLIEIGPRPGRFGGHVCFAGNYSQLLASDTLSGRYLSGRTQIASPQRRALSKDAPYLSVYNATLHNLKQLSVHIPQQAFVCLSGVSGSGKSTLLNQVIYQNLLAQSGQMAESAAPIDSIESSLAISEVVLIDQSPVSKTPRSNPASYSGAWNEIRKCFAQTESALSAGMSAGHFSFNSGDGRCDACNGLGYEQVEMQFVSDVYVPCETCQGQRFKPEVLAVQFQGKSVADILEMEVSEAVDFFAQQPKIVRCLSQIDQVGLGYLKLGQALNTLSGGESQRLKLVRYLGKLASRAGHTLILIDEPSTGLHRSDVRILISVLQRLVDAGHSLVVIEHSIDFLKVADWIIEMGPGAGKDGGQIIAAGTPEHIAQQPCPTAPYLKAALNDSEAPLIAEDKRCPASAETALTALSVQGAREHNLKNLHCHIPHQQITVLTGVSGSGKSTLAFDIIFAEGQRRFMESMSAYARQFVEQLPRPEVDQMTGVLPTVAVEQRVTRGTAKSTVATITEVAQYLRLLFARIGEQYTLESGLRVQDRSEDQLFQALHKWLQTAREGGSAAKLTIGRGQQPFVYLCAPLIRNRKGHHQPLADWAQSKGYQWLRVDGQLVQIEKFEKLDRYREHDIELIVGELNANSSNASLRERLKEALLRGNGSTFLMSPKGKILQWYSTKRCDPQSGEPYPELEPKLFSWNSPKGWCPRCRGHGFIDDPNKLTKSKAAEANKDTENKIVCPECQGARMHPRSQQVYLPLKPGAYKLSHSRQHAINFPELLKGTAAEVLDTLAGIQRTERSHAILAEILPEIESRMAYMQAIGLDYLTLDRTTASLSGGEAQRIRLAAQLGSRLSGVLYVLDEPSIGLHARDNQKLLQSLQTLKDRGNTLLIVEHAAETMRHADQVIDIGPAAGVHGGQLVAQGTLNELMQQPASITGRYLKNPMQHPLRGAYRSLPKPWGPRRKMASLEWIALQGAQMRNLKGIDVYIPKQRLVAVCGVSGAGKSTLIRDLLKPLIEQAIAQQSDKLLPKAAPAQIPARAFKQLQGAQGIRKLIEVDPSPIGKTSRSTPATYIGAFDLIRKVFADVPEARLRGYHAGTFSFNTQGGRCEHCKGSGKLKLEMHFMPDSYVQCEHCQGRRYSAELEGIRWNGHSIADVLEMSFEKAAEFFSFHRELKDLMQLMVDTGLGYLKLGQASPSLSGGEAQRLKLVSELAKGRLRFEEKNSAQRAGNLYLLEEPSIGLHLKDCERLIQLLNELVDQGHTVIVIEHQPDLIASADYVIELGPEGGEQGGELIYQGTVAELKQHPLSATGPFLTN